MISLNNKRLVQALALLMFISAVLHMVVLLLHFLITADYAPFNFFRIIGLDIFYPDFVASPFSGYLSLVIIVSIYVLSYIFLLQKKKR